MKSTSCDGGDIMMKIMLADCFERSKFSASAPITTSSSTKAASQTDGQTDSYSRSDDRPTNRRACACAVQAVHELQKRSKERKRGVVEQTRATPLLSAYQQRH